MKSEDIYVPAIARVYEFGEFRLEAANLSLFRNSEVVSLAPKACEVLLVLVESNNRIVKKDEILERVWADTFVEEANLTHHISALRKALGEDKTGRRFIETIPRRGYRFVHAVEEIKHAAPEIIISKQTRTRITEEIVIESSEPQPLENVNRAKSVLPLSSAKNSQRRWQSAALAGTIAVVAFAAIGYALYQFTHPSPMIFKAKRTTRITATGKVKFAAVSPDGKYITYAQEENGDRQSLWTHHIASESAVQIAAPTAVQYRGLNISPDGNQLYYVLEEGSLYQMPILGGTTKKIADGLLIGTSKLVDVGISPDGKQIAFVRRFEKGVSALFIVNRDGTNERTLATFEQPVRLGSSVAWSPDGKIIACRVDQNVLAVRVDDGTSAPVRRRKV